MNDAETTEQGQKGVAKLAGDLKVVVRDAEALVKASADDLGEKAREARRQLGVRLEAARESLGRMEGRVQEQVRAGSQVIRQHPYESIGLAFGFGLLIGALLKR